MRIDSIGNEKSSISGLPSIVVLIGPNNSGKSQTLRDIESVTASKRRAATDVVYGSLPETIDELLLERFGVNLEEFEGEANIPLSGLGSNLSSAGPVTVNIHQARSQLSSGVLHPSLAPHHFARLDSTSRLSIVRDVESHDSGSEAPTSLLHVLYDDDDLQPSLSSAFEQAFGLQLHLDYSSLKRMRLRVGPDFSDVALDPRTARKQLAHVESLSGQGDGFRSYAGIVLGCLYARDRVVLLDEPEAFLHPIQANQLGAWLAEEFVGSEGQLFVATHSHALLSGMLTNAGDDDCAVIRLNRADDTTYHRLDSGDLKLLTTDPLLMSTRVLEALFSPGVVLCEGDSDHAIYSQVAATADEPAAANFTNSLNKQSAVKILRLLDRCRVPACAILDFDFLSVWAEVKTACKSALDESDFARLRELQQALDQALPDTKSDADYLQDIADAIDEAKQDSLDVPSTRSLLKRLRAAGSRWSGPKERGVDHFEDPELRAHAEEAVELVKKAGIRLVPCGDLEGFFPSLDVKKQRIVGVVLPDMKKHVSPELRDFVEAAAAAATRYVDPQI